MPVEVRSRCPIDHPEYHYPPSRNPYWFKLNDLQKHVYLDNQTEEHGGIWRAQFEPSEEGLSRALHVEVGCNAGHVIVEWAKAHPGDAYIGVDWKFKPIFRGAEKSSRRSLQNLLFFRAHAERIQYMFGPQEIDYLYLFFPDPWSKKSQWKNRLITAERLLQIVKVMKPSGIFHIKTDHPGYFKWILEALNEVSHVWNILELSHDLYHDHPAPETLQIPEVTLFEKLFIKDKIPIQSLKIQPKACIES